MIAFSNSMNSIALVTIKTMNRQTILLLYKNKGLQSELELLLFKLLQCIKAVHSCLWATEAQQLIFCACVWKLAREPPVDPQAKPLTIKCPVSAVVHSIPFMLWIEIKCKRKMVCHYHIRLTNSSIKKELLENQMYTHTCFFFSIFKSTFKCHDY